MRSLSSGLFALGVVTMVLSWEGLSASQRGALVGIVLCLAAVLVRLEDAVATRSRSTGKPDRSSAGT